MTDSSSNRHSSASPTAPQIPFYALSRISSNAGPAMSLNTQNLEPSSSMASLSSDSSSSSSNSNTASSYISNLTSWDKDSSTAHQADSFPSNNSQSRIMESRPVSPFHAPQPPPPHQPSRNPFSQPTAIRSYATSYSSPDPPVILPTENSTAMSPSSFRSQAPYFPFLSHAPPPENTWIEVETLQNEYKLHVRLPGFTREGITLATKRRRILHVVADKWENGGGESFIPVSHHKQTLYYRPL